MKNFIVTFIVEGLATFSGPFSTIITVDDYVGFIDSSGSPDGSLIGGRGTRRRFSKVGIDHFVIILTEIKRIC